MHNKSLNIGLLNYSLRNRDNKRLIIPTNLYILKHMNQDYLRCTMYLSFQRMKRQVHGTTRMHGAIR